MIRVGAFLSIIYRIMFEWCYQGEDYDEAVKRYYGNCSKVGKSQIEAASKELVKDLGQKKVQDVNVKFGKKEKPFQKKADAEDAVYFMNI